MSDKITPFAKLQLMSKENKSFNSNMELNLNTATDFLISREVIQSFKDCMTVAEVESLIQSLYDLEERLHTISNTNEKEFKKLAQELLGLDRDNSSAPESESQEMREAIDRMQETILALLGNDELGEIGILDRFNFTVEAALNEAESDVRKITNEVANSLRVLGVALDQEELLNLEGELKIAEANAFVSGRSVEKPLLEIKKLLQDFWFAFREALSQVIMEYNSDEMSLIDLDTDKLANNSKIKKRSKRRLLVESGAAVFGIIAPAVILQIFNIQAPEGFLTFVSFYSSFVFGTLAHRLQKGYIDKPRDDRDRKNIISSESAQLLLSGGIAKKMDAGKLKTKRQGIIPVLGSRSQRQELPPKSQK